MKRSSIILLVVAVAGLSGTWAAIHFGWLGPMAVAADGNVPAGGHESYGVAFAAELNKLGQLSVEEFSGRFANKGNHAAALSWDPTTAKFWDRLNQDMKQNTQAEFYDFRLNAQELTKFKTNGFVVSERMGERSCTEMFYRIYKRDLPVFVTTDAVLHAWHRSYDAILVEVEMHMLIPTLDEILTGMAQKIPDAMKNYPEGDWQESLKDADYFLTVARSLLAGKKVKSALGQDAAVEATLTACDQLKLQRFMLFGKERWVDFSQFKPRGHYETKEELRRYFKAMMWCGRMDMRVAGDPKVVSLQQLAAAVTLHDLLERSGKFPRWQQFDDIIQTFVGDADSMTFAQLGIVLEAAGIKSPADLKTPAALADLQKRIGSGKFGKQEIRGDVFEVDATDPNTYILPHTFCFLGQKFAIDSWVTAKVVYDEIIWNDEKLQRRVPSCLDVAFAAFGNNHVTPLLAERIKNPAGKKFRDGLNYQHNLAAARQVIDSKPAGLWQKNLYTGWLGCLRELSKPTTDTKYPEAMRTQAWGMKATNTQLASWTQLRHDTILYVKQSYTGMPMCYYPAGYVEPVPHFWKQMEQMAQRAVKQIENTPYPQPVFQKKHADFFRSFAAKLSILRGIAEKELAQKELDKAETKFLEDVVEAKHVKFGSGSKREYAGWYPGLFYLGGEDSTKWDALVADVHTDPPAPILDDPGCVLHQGVGSVDLLVIAVDSGKDRMIFVGPTLSHYEFEMPGVSRKTDSEWKQVLRAGKAPPRPEWTQSYLVPGVNEIQKYYYGS